MCIAKNCENNCQNAKPMCVDLLFYFCKLLGGQLCWSDTAQKSRRMQGRMDCMGLQL